MRFEVSRKTWLNGSTPQGESITSESMLLRDDGMMCCLGHRAIATGMTPEQILGVKSPAGYFNPGAVSGYPVCEKVRNCRSFDFSTHDVPEEWTAFLRDKDSEDSHACDQIMVKNDSTDLDNKVREQHLIELFAEIGDEIVFVD